MLELNKIKLGYDVNIRISTPSETPELIGKGGTAYVGNDGKHTVIINSEYLNGKSKGEILGVISEEASHIINGVDGRTVVTGTDEKGLESKGRATKEYFEYKYKDDKTTINLTSEGSIDTSNLGTNVGDKLILQEKKDAKGNRETDDGRKKIVEVLYGKNTEKTLEYTELKENIRKEILEALSKDTVDVYEEKLIDGNLVINIKKKGILQSGKTLSEEEKRTKTLAIRELIEGNYTVYFQTTENNKILEEMVGAYVNIANEKKDGTNKYGIVFINPKPEYEYLNSDGVLKTQTVAGGITHEVAGHAAEDAWKMNKKISDNLYFNKSQNIEIAQTLVNYDEFGNKKETVVKYVYFKYQVQEIKDNKTGKITYRAYGVPISEANSIYMENVGRQESNRRRLYMPDDTEFIKEFSNKKDMEIFFIKEVIK